MSDPITYRFSTFQELVDEVPSDRICDCLEELGKVIQTAKATAELIYKVAEDLARKKELPPMPKRIIKLPDALEWIDDGKGELEAQINDETGKPFVGFKITKESDTRTDELDALKKTVLRLMDEKLAVEAERDALKRDTELTVHERALHYIHQQKWLKELIEAKAERDALRSDRSKLTAMLNDAAARAGHDGYDEETELWRNVASHLDRFKDAAHERIATLTAERDALKAAVHEGTYGKHGTVALAAERDALKRELSDSEDARQNYIREFHVVEKENDALRAAIDARKEQP